jgi:hypothetical protein
MTIFSELADEWQIADDAFSVLEQAAFSALDDGAFDTANEQRKRNDQAYFLYLFTRFEAEVNKAVKVLIQNRVTGIGWPERRIWEAWSRRGVDDVPFMSKVEVLTDKSRADYATVKEYYDGRNEVAHGGVWSEQFVIRAVAQRMEAICHSFPAL